MRSMKNSRLDPDALAQLKGVVDSLDICLTGFERRLGGDVKMIGVTKNMTLRALEALDVVLTGVPGFKDVRH